MTGYSTKSNAMRSVRKNYGPDAKEGYDYTLEQSKNGNWHVIPGSKYDDPRQKAWETAMGLRGYDGSPAQKEDLQELNNPNLLYGSRGK